MNKGRIKEKYYEKKSQKQGNSKSEDRIKDFKVECKYGPIFVCISCKRLLFKRGVRKFKDNMIPKDMMRLCLPIKQSRKPSTSMKHDESFKVLGDFHVCHTCLRYLKSSKMPPICSKDRLEYMETPNCLKLTNLEKQLIVKNFLFIKV